MEPRELTLLGELVAVEPLAEDGCLYCDNGPPPLHPHPEALYEHKPSCPWLQAVDLIAEHRARGLLADLDAL